MQIFGEIPFFLNGIAYVKGIKFHINQKKTLILLITVPKLFSNSFSICAQNKHPNEICINSNYYLMMTLNFDLCDEGEIYISDLKM